MDKKKIITISVLIGMLLLFALIMWFIFGKKSGGSGKDNDEEDEEDDEDGGGGGGTDGGGGGTDGGGGTETKQTTVTQQVSNVYNVKSDEYSSQHSPNGNDRSGARLLTNEGFWSTHDNTYINPSGKPITSGDNVNWLTIDNSKTYGQFVIFNLANAAKYTYFYLKTVETNSPRKFLIIGMKSNVWKTLYNEENGVDDKIYYQGLNNQDTYESYGILVTESQNVKTITIQNLFFVDKGQLTIDNFEVEATSTTSLNNSPRQTINRSNYKLNNLSYVSTDKSILWKTEGEAYSNGNSKNFYGGGDGSSWFGCNPGQWIIFKFTEGRVITKFRFHGNGYDNGKYTGFPSTITIFGSTTGVNAKPTKILENVKLTIIAHKVGNTTKYNIESIIEFNPLYIFNQYGIQVHSVNNNGKYVNVQIDIFS